MAHDDDRSDLQTRDDIELLVREFYREAAVDDLLEPIFAAAQIDWPAHIERITDFWAWATARAEGLRAQSAQGPSAGGTTAPRLPRPTTRVGSSCSSARSTSTSSGQSPRQRRGGQSRWRMPSSGLCRGTQGRVTPRPKWRSSAPSPAIAPSAVAVNVCGVRDESGSFLEREPIGELRPIVTWNTCGMKRSGATSPQNPWQGVATIYWPCPNMRSRNAARGEAGRRNTANVCGRGTRRPTTPDRRRGPSRSIVGRANRRSVRPRARPNEGPGHHEPNRRQRLREPVDDPTEAVETVEPRVPGEDDVGIRRTLQQRRRPRRSRAVAGAAARTSASPARDHGRRSSPTPERA